MKHDAYERGFSNNLDQPKFHGCNTNVTILVTGLSTYVTSQYQPVKVTQVGLPVRRMLMKSLPLGGNRYSLPNMDLSLLIFGYLHRRPSQSYSAVHITGYLYRQIL